MFFSSAKRASAIYSRKSSSLSGSFKIRSIRSSNNVNFLFCDWLNSFFLLSFPFTTACKFCFKFFASSESVRLDTLNRFLAILSAPSSNSPLLMPGANFLISLNMLFSSFLSIVLLASLKSWSIFFDFLFVLFDLLFDLAFHGILSCYRSKI